jgi:Uma2 family endonuclease
VGARRGSHHRDDRSQRAGRADRGQYWGAAQAGGGPEGLPCLFRRHADPTIRRHACRQQGRPDLLVRCGLVTNKNYVTDLLVVVEALFPSTIDVDRGDKLRFYKLLPTPVHIVLVYQDQMRAEYYRRVDSGWETEVLTHPGDVLVLEALGSAISLREASVGVEPGV